MFSMKELLKDKKIEDCTAEQKANLKDLLVRLNKLRADYGKPLTVTSGLRNDADMKRIYKSDNYPKKSKHLFGQAVDISDPKGELREWVLSNLEDFKTKYCLWMEDFRYTKGWVHFQSSPPASSSRIFVPSNSAPPNPELWVGKYDKKCD